MTKESAKKAKKWMGINWNLFFVLIILQYLVMAKILPPYLGLLFSFLYMYSFIMISIIYKEEDLYPTINTGTGNILTGFGIAFYILAFSLPSIISTILNNPNSSDLLENFSLLIISDFKLYMIIIAGIGFVLWIITTIIESKNKKTRFTIRYWIQHSNIDTEEKGKITYLKAKKIIDNYNWEKELLNKQLLDRSKKDVCPPGIGFNTIYNQTFVIQGQGKDIFNLFLIIPKKSKFFGIKLLEYFFKGDYNQILKEIELR